MATFICLLLSLLYLDYYTTNSLIGGLVTVPDCCPHGFSSALSITS